MQSEADCLRVATVFESRGMEFQQQRATKSRQDTSRPTTAVNQNRPSSMLTNSPFFQLSPTQPARPDPFSRPPPEAGGLSLTRPNSSIQPLTQIDDQYTQSPNQSRGMPPPRLFARDESIIPRDVEPNRPTTAQMYRASTTPYHSSQYEHTNNAAMAYSHTAKRQASASLIHDLDYIREEAINHVSPPQTSSYDDQRLSFNQDFHSGHAATYAVSDLHNQQSASLETQPPTGRPTTVAGTNSNIFVQEDSLRPQSHAGLIEGTSSRPASASLNLPPLPRPKSVRKNLSPIKPDPKASTSDMLLPPPTASPQKRSFDVYSESLNSTSGALTSESQTYDASVSPSKTSLTSTPTPSPTKLSPMEELLARKRPLLPRPQNAGVGRLDSVADALHEIVSPPSTAASPMKAVAATAVPEGQQAVPKNDENRHSKHPTRNAVGLQQSTHLEAYAAQCREDRAAAMDDFIVANLENPAFTTLCEDVENCWRRVALGL